MPRRTLKKIPEILRKRTGAEVFFFDEGRFGLQPVAGRRWAKKGERPVSLVCPGYKNFYLYSAVNPISGEDASLILPWVNTAMMNLFLVHLSKVLNTRSCFLIMDQAGWHTSGDLKVPSQIEIVLLPPYSPELNPVERLWQWLKRHSLRNRFFEDIDAVMDSVQDCFQGITPQFLKSLCSCNYLQQK